MAGQIREINCNPKITHRLVNGYVQYCPLRCNNDQHMMQMARLITTEAQEWCRTNFEMTCYGEHFSLVFYSGARQNKFVIQMVGKEIHVNVVGESWRMWLQNKVQQYWDWFKGFAVYIADKAVEVLKAAAPRALIAGGLKAIGL